VADLTPEQVLAALPHREPFRFVDEILAIDDEHIVAAHRFRSDADYYRGHFPGHPVTPGVLILEAMAQAAGILSFRSRGVKPDESSVYYYVGIDRARFKKPVVPGDQLEIEVHIERELRGIAKFNCWARVEGKTVAEATILCAMQGAGK
jgi:3-hydroxyacyl-[acyl-carrier-protein] dehydratase